MGVHIVSKLHVFTRVKLFPDLEEGRGRGEEEGREENETKYLWWLTT